MPRIKKIKEKAKGLSPESLSHISTSLQLLCKRGPKDDTTYLKSVIYAILIREKIIATDLHDKLLLEEIKFSQADFIRDAHLNGPEYSYLEDEMVLGFRREEISVLILPMAQKILEETKETIDIISLCGQSINEVYSNLEDYYFMALADVFFGMVYFGNFVYGAIPTDFSGRYPDARVNQEDYFNMCREKVGKYCIVKKVYR